MVAHDQHVDDVEADLDVGLPGVGGEPACRGELEVAAGDLAVLERPLAVLLGGDVDEDQAQSSSFATRSTVIPSFEVQPVSRIS